MASISLNLGSNIDSTTTKESSWTQIGVYNGTSSRDGYALYSSVSAKIEKSSGYYKLSTYFKIKGASTKSNDTLTIPSTIVTSGTNAYLNGSGPGFKLKTISLSRDFPTKPVRNISTSGENYGQVSGSNSIQIFNNDIYTNQTKSFSVFFSITLSSGDIGNILVTYTISGSIKGTKSTSCTITLNGNGGTVRGSTSIIKNIWDTIDQRTYIATRDKEKCDTYSYKAYFYLYKKGPLYHSESTAQKDRYYNYTQNGWNTSTSGGPYGGSIYSAITVTGNMTLYAQWIRTEVPSAREAITLSYTPDKPGRLGYTFQRWVNSNGSEYSPGTGLTSDINVYGTWSPKLYDIIFDLAGGKIPESEPTQSISSYTISSKQYGTNSVTAPSFTPYKLGYSFAGWSDKKDGKIVMPGGKIDDTYYDNINTAQTNKSVILYAQWTPKKNILKFVYYLSDDDTEPETDTITYTIERANKIVTKNAPKNLRGGDFAFLGWCDQMPKGWNTERTVYTNNGYHGTYTIPPEKVISESGNKIDIELPVTIDINKLTKLEDWGVTETYYGVWAKSGKRIKIGGSWKKVVRSYVKINGEWKLITDIWVKDNNVDDKRTNEYWPWHHEI